jgi:hypothetical protein
MIKKLRNWLAYKLCELADAVAIENVMFEKHAKWKFKRSPITEPYSAVPGSKFCRPDSRLRERKPNQDWIGY